MGSTQALSPTEIRAELERILVSAPFANSRRSQRFLRYVIEASLKGGEEYLKEYEIAVEVFERGPSYDPTVDATVRVEAGRLRSRLRDYYASEGLKDPVVIEIRKGGYRATFSERANAATATIPEPPQVVTSPPAGEENSKGWLQRFDKRRMAGFMLAGVILSVAIAGVTISKRQAPHSSAADSGPKGLAVLPFSNQTGTEANDYLTEGLTDNLIRQFSQLPDLRVISRAAADRVNKKNAAGELGIGFLLTGELQRNSEGHLVLNSELSNAKDGTVLRSNQYLPDESDLRPIQADIVQDVVKGLGISLNEGQSKQAQRPLTSSSAAFEDFLRGESAIRRRDDAEGLRSGIRSFEDAVRLDPSFALAYSSMSEGHLELGIYFAPPREHMPLAREYAERALALDPTIGQAHAILGLVDLLYDWKLSSAQSELSAADSRDNAIWQLGCTAHLLGASGRYRHAREDLQRLLEFDPRSPMLISEMGCVNYYAGEYDDSIRYYHQALAIDPRSLLAYWGLGRSLAGEKRYREALDTLKRFKTINGFEPPVISAEIGYTEAASGDRHAAQKTMRLLQEESKHIYVDPYFVAIIHLALKDRAGTYAWLDRAYQERSPFLISIATDPRWGTLQSDPRFQELWNRMMQVGKKG